MRGLLSAYRINFALIALAALMVGLVGVGVMSKGKPGTLTWGPSVDINAAAIAFNEMYTGKLSGIGRKETALAAASYLTETGDETNIGQNPAFVTDPDRVTKAFQAARQVYTPSLKPVTLDSRMVVTTMAEDIGYVDFYYLGFSLFGVGAYSTYLLFLTLFAGTAAIFAAGNWRSAPNLACLTLATTAFFLMTTGAETFNTSAPSLAANRFLATLVVIPALHVLLFALSKDRPRRDELAFFILQAVLFAFLITLRSSGAWAVLGFVAAAGMVFAIRVIRWTMSKAEKPEGVLPKMIALPGFARLAGSVVLVLALTSGWASVRASQLHILYESDDILPHHMRWHSAALGLALHPDWDKNLLSPAIAGVQGDGIGMLTYQAFMEENMPGTPFTSSLNGSYKFGWEESVLKEMVSDYIASHPVYAMQLYFWYKPTKTLDLIFNSLKGIPALAWLLAIPGVVLTVWALLPAGANRLMPALGVTIFSGASWAPVIWAYPGEHVIADQAFVFLFFVLFLVACALALGASKLLANERFRAAIPGGVP